MTQSKPELDKYASEIAEAENEEKLPYSPSVLKRIREYEEKQKSQNSFVAPMKPGKAESKRPGARGPPTKEVERAPPVASRPTENRVPSGVPTTLEGALQFDGEGRSVHEVLGVLVNAHEKQAKAILGRTNLVDHEDVIAVADIFNLAKHGIGGKFEAAHPFLSEWALDILEALPSVEGASRKEFVGAWASAEKERARAQAEAERLNKRIGN